jgi:ABC-2 type transport system permease protein
VTRAIRAILFKELRELWRDPLSLVLALVLPMVLLILFGYGLNLDVPPVRLGVLDLDRSASSRDYIASTTASGDLRLTAQAQSAADLEAWLDEGSIDLGVIVPTDFEDMLVQGQPAGVQVLVDGSRPPQARAALAELDAAADAYTLRLAAGALRPAIVAQPRVWFNPELRSVNYIVPGLFSIILMTLAPLLSTLAIVREREHGSIQQILVAPVSPVAFIIGKAVPYTLLAFAELLLVVAGGLLWFRIDFRGSVGLLLFAGAIFSVCAVALGLLVSTVTRSQVVAMLLAIVVTIMPTFLFSGFLFPVYSMVERYKALSVIFPARYFTEIARGIALRGQVFSELWPQIAALSVITVVLLVAATSRFHRRMG